MTNVSESESEVDAARLFAGEEADLLGPASDCEEVSSSELEGDAGGIAIAFN